MEAHEEHGSFFVSKEIKAKLRARRGLYKLFMGHYAPHLLIRASSIYMYYHSKARASGPFGREASWNIKDNNILIIINGFNFSISGRSS